MVNQKPDVVQVRKKRCDAQGKLLMFPLLLLKTLQEPFETQPQNNDNVLASMKRDTRLPLSLFIFATY